MRLIIGMCLSVAVLSSAAANADKGKNRTAPENVQMQELARCKVMTDGQQRLACYDQAAAGLLSAEQKADIIVVDRQEVESTNRSLFGFSLPDVSLFRRHGAAIQAPDEIEGVIASASADASGQWTFRLQDGGVWHQTDTNELGRSPNAGDPVKVRRAAFGSYMLNVGKAPGIHVRRIG